MFARLLRGTTPEARFPLGDRADRRGRAMFELYSSMNTNVSVGSRLACSCQAARSASFCSLARLASGALRVAGAIRRLERLLSLMDDLEYPWASRYRFRAST